MVSNVDKAQWLRSPRVLVLLLVCTGFFAVGTTFAPSDRRIEAQSAVSTAGVDTTQALPGPTTDEDSAFGFEVCTLRGGSTIDYSVGRLTRNDELSVATIQALVDLSSQRIGWSSGPRTETHLEGPDLRALASRESVWDLFALDDATATNETDRMGDDFERFEIAPKSRPFVLPNLWRLLPIVDIEVVYALDLWTDSSGRVERMRFLSNPEDGGWPGMWTEMRFLSPTSVLPVLDTEASDEPTQSCVPGEATEEGWIGQEEFDQTLVMPLIISLDDSGRPYDREADGTVASTHLGQLDLSAGAILIVQGLDDPGEGQPFEELDLDIGNGTIDVWALQNDGPNGWASTVGFRLDVPGTEVVQWSTAHEDLWGPGAVTSATLGPLVDQTDWWSLQADGSTLDLDLSGTNETLTSPGLVYDEIGFDVVNGLDADLKVVSVVLWAPAFAPWRLAIPEGEPPAWVIQREAEFQECLDGTRRIDVFGNCTSD